MTSFPNFQKKTGSGHAGQPARRGARILYMNVLDSRCIALTSLVYRFDYEFVVLSGMSDARYQTCQSDTS
jgi:hypothetical protein